MKKDVFLAGAIALLISGVLPCKAYTKDDAEKPADLLEWPPVTKNTRPWTRWWWMGSAVDPENLERELSRYQEAGLGGVEITPIYGVKGRESQFIEYLSPRWMEMMQYSVSTADKLGMGVDMATGTGWCFGGPNVSAGDANASVICRTTELKAGEKPAGHFDSRQTQALVAYPAGDGESVEITGKIDAQGVVDWSAPARGAPWTVYAVSQKPSGVVVKRPAPGGAGPMLNPLCSATMDRYLQRFSQAFEAAGKDAPKPAAMFHDSYEYKSDWAPDFFAEFEKRRGYKLQNELPALFGKETSDHVARVKSDYRETISDIMADETIPVWTNWAHQHGFTTREQAHGSPGNWLDIYAAADVPETEMFNRDRDIPVSRFASSAAHVTGKTLVGAEAGTWVAEHFNETLADLKGVVDDLFLSGANRITFHGTAYSPGDAAWPGWCFYASTELNPRNALWRDLPALTAYITRVQSVLQAGESDNNVLVYWPIHDCWHDPQGLVQPFTIHEREWLYSQPVGAVMKLLCENGVQFDDVSDKQLAEATVRERSIICENSRYQTIIIPPCRHMPVETLAKLDQLVSSGARVIFCESIPTDVPGAYRVQERREKLLRLKSKLESTAGPRCKILPSWSDLTRIICTEDNLNEDNCGIPFEPMVREAGCTLVRRRYQGGEHLFVVNTSGKRIDRWVRLGDCAVEAVAIMDPTSGQGGMAKIKPGEHVAAQTSGLPEVYLQLEPGQSVVLRIFASGQKFPENIPAWKYFLPSGRPTELKGRWSVKFIDGGPAFPAAQSVENLVSWTSFAGQDGQSFAGSAQYTCNFDFPAPVAPYCSLDLGEVHSSARVHLNGKDLGTVFTKPFRLTVDDLKPAHNVLEIEVTGTSANRIRDLDVKKVPWKIFYDANIVTKDYQPFDASGWAVQEQGLIGPVTLQPEMEIISF